MYAGTHELTIDGDRVSFRHTSKQCIIGLKQLVFVLAIEDLLSENALHHLVAVTHSLDVLQLADIAGRCEHRRSIHMVLAIVDLRDLTREENAIEITRVFLRRL